MTAGLFWMSFAWASRKEGNAFDLGDGRGTDVWDRGACSRKPGATLAATHDSAPRRRSRTLVPLARLRRRDGWLDDLSYCGPPHSEYGSVVWRDALHRGSVFPTGAQGTLGDC